MSQQTVVKGNRRQPGQASKNIRKNAGSDPNLKTGKGRKGAPGFPPAVTPTPEQSGNVDGHGNAGLSGVDDKQ